MSNDFLGNIGAGGYDMDSLYRTIQQMQSRLAQLQQGQDVGNLFYGGPVKTYISTSGWSSGPFIENLDSTHDIDFNLWVPDYLLRVLRVQFRLRPKSIRSSVTVAASLVSLEASSGGASTSGASSVTSLPAGGGVTADSTSTPSGGGSTSGNGGSSTPTSGSNSVAESVASNLHTHNETGSVTSTESAGKVVAAHNHTHDVTIGDHNHSTPAHTHPSHDHDVPSHSHDIGHTHTTPNHIHAIADHDHDLTLGISESGMASQLRVWVDGVDRSATLGGPWDAAATFDIAPYLQDVRRKPVAGDHAIKIESDTVGAIELWIDWFVITQPVR